MPSRLENLGLTIEPEADDRRLSGHSPASSPDRYDWRMTTSPIKHGWAVREEYAALAPTYERRWRRYLEVSAAHTLTMLAPHEGEDILDAGCGTGLLLGRIAGRAPGARLSGVDLTREMIRQAHTHMGYEGRLAVADLGALPFPDAVFDAVIVSSVLHYLPDAGPALAEAARVLKTHGRLVITAWDGGALRMRALALWLSRRGGAPVHLCRPEALVTQCEAAGFEFRRQDMYSVDHLWPLRTSLAVKMGR